MSSPSGRPAAASSSFLGAFFVSAAGTGLSRVLGAARDMALAAVLGAGASSDAFWIAFTIPNVFRRFVADEGLTGALVPAIARAEAEVGPEAAHDLADAIAAALLVANALLIALGIAGAELLVYAFAANFAEDPAKFALTTSLTRVMMPFLAMVSAVSMFEGLLNHRGHFFVPKIAPGLVSIGIIGGAAIAGRFDEPATVIAWGCIAGGIAHVAIHVPVLHRYWGHLGLRFSFGDPRLRLVMRELSKVVAIGVFAQINILVLRQLASFVGDGAITRYWYANRLVDLAQGMIAVAIGSALLPGISRAVAAADPQAFQRELAGALRLAMFLLLPVAGGLVVFAQPLASLLFRRGAYTWADTVATADALTLLVPFMLAVAAINIFKKVFFALEDRNPLLWVGAFGTAITLGLGLLWVAEYGILGLAAALSASTVVQAGAYLALLRVRVPHPLGLAGLTLPALRMAAATAPAVAILFGAARLGAWEDGATWINVAVAFCGLAAAATVYLGAAWALGIGEIARVLGRLRRRR